MSLSTASIDWQTIAAIPAVVSDGDQTVTLPTWKVYLDVLQWLEPSEYSKEDSTRLQLAGSLVEYASGVASSMVSWPSLGFVPLSFAVLANFVPFFSPSLLCIVGLPEQCVHPIRPTWTNTPRPRFAPVLYIIVRAPHPLVQERL